MLVLEKLNRKEITEHLQASNFLSKHQHRFGSGISYFTQLLEYFLDLEDAIDEGECVDVVFLVCRKAFDTVPHGRLLANRWARGKIGGKLPKGQRAE